MEGSGDTTHTAETSMQEEGGDDDELVEDFLKRVSWEFEAGELIVDREQSENEKQDACIATQRAHAHTHIFSEIESHRMPQAVVFHDNDEGSASTRRCVRSDEAPVVIQRPIPFTATSISFDPGEQRYRLEVEDMDWYNHILERYVDAGYGPRSNSLGNIASIVGIFQSLPPDLADVLKEGLHALQVLRATPATSRRPWVNAAPADEGTEGFSAIEDAMWEDNEECGYLRFEWDPATERRRCPLHLRLTRAR
jgi:hypothetical protein